MRWPVLLAALIAAGCGEPAPEARAPEEPERDRTLEHPPITPGAPGIAPRHVGRQTVCAGGDRSCALWGGRPACWSAAEAPRFVGEITDANLLACDATTLCVHVPPDRVECGDVELRVEALNRLWVRGGAVCIRDAQGVRCWRASEGLDPNAAELHPDAIEVLRAGTSTCVVRSDAIDCGPNGAADLPALRHLDGAAEACGIDPEHRWLWCWTDEATPTRVAALDGADAVAVGSAQICVRAAGLARCVDREDRSSVHDKALEGVVELVAGTDHACARTRDGRLHCWRGADGDPVEITAP